VAGLVVGAQEAAQDRALNGATGARGGVQPRVVRDFKGWFQERGWDAHRSSDDHGCVQPVPAALAGGGRRGRIRSGCGPLEGRSGYGLPWAIRTTTARRFASSAGGRACPRLGGVVGSSWHSTGAIEAAIPERTAVTSGMHRTLKQGSAAGRGLASAQQRATGPLPPRSTNQVRPHEALGMQTPASVYEPSPRAYPERLPEVDYPDTMQGAQHQEPRSFPARKKHDVFLSEGAMGRAGGPAAV